MYEEVGVVVEAIQFVVDMPVLQVCKACPVRRQLLLEFGIDIKICFVGGFVIVPVVIRKTAVLRPNDISVMFAIIAVPSAAQGELGIILFILQGKNAAEKIIIEPALADQAGRLEGVVTHDIRL